MWPASFHGGNGSGAGCRGAWARRRAGRATSKSLRADPGERARRFGDGHVAMTGPMVMVFGILAGAIGLFAWGRPRVDIVAILVVLALILSRVLTPHEALAGFGDPVVVLIAAIFIVGEALVNTGVVHRLGEVVIKFGGGNETRLIILIMALAGAIGAFMSSSAIVAMFIPLVLTVAGRGLKSCSCRCPSLR